MLSRILLTLFLSLLTAPLLAQQKVTLNFTDMDIQLLINTISEVTKKTFIVDPRVKAKVTVVSNSPLDSEEIYEVFLSILSVHGFSAIPSGSVTKIMPENLAKSENTPVLSASEQHLGDALITQVIQLKHIAAAQLIPLLRPLVHQQGHLVAYPNNNTLIISDRAAAVKRILEIIQRIDLPTQEEIEVIVLQYATASEITRLLTQMEQQSAANAATGGKTTSAQIVADDRTNSLLINGDQDKRLHLRTLIAHLDIPVKSSGNTQVIYLRYAQAAELANILKGITQGIVETQELAEGKKITVQTHQTYIQADENTNSLIITATPEILQDLRIVIQKLDIRRAQVLVEAVIAEVANDIAQKLGVQWLLYGNRSLSPLGTSNFDNTGPKIIDLATTAYQFNQNRGTSLPSPEAGAMLGLGYFNNSAINFAMLIQALSSDVNTNVLSTPSLLTLDNEEAEIVVGQNVPFVTGQYTNTGAVSGATNPFQTIQREDVGLKLKVRPQINEGNAVKLEIEQEVSSISPSSVATADIITNKRTIKTTVIVEDGNMIVLGGLIDEDLQQITQKVPGLGDIPILGGLFRSHSTKKIKRNLMVFLHPVIVRDAATEQLISSGKYKAMRDKQLALQDRGIPLLPSQEVPVLPALDQFLAILPNGEVLAPSKPLKWIE